MRPPRRLRLLILAAALLLAVAVPALGKTATGKPPTRTRTFTTGPFAVTCTSTRQLCAPAEPLTFRLPRRGVLTAVEYVTAASHCSSVRLHVLHHGHQVAQTKILPSGKSTDRLKLHLPLGRGRTTFRFQAEGFVGGCNVGRVFSWGGTITVTVSLSQ